MNRSVISATIAAGLLFAGPSALGAAAAGADPGPPAKSDEAGSRATRCAGATDGAGATGRGPRFPFRDQSGGVRPAPRPINGPATPSGPAGNSGFGQIPVPPAPRVPIAVLSGGAERGLPESPDMLDPFAREAPGFDTRPAALLPAPDRPVPAQRAASAPAPPRPVLRVSSPGPIPQAAPQVPSAARPAAPPIPSAVPVPPGLSRQPEPARGLPLGGLPDPDIAGMAARALPGLAAILGMTALGAVVGYRQAKAGQLLPAAGVGRFLQ